MFVPKPPIVAYVTFATVAGKHAALAAYPKGLLHHWFMSPGRMLRKKRIVVKQAPAPASLAWEHIGTPRYLVKLREVGVAALTSLWMLLPLVVVYVGRKTTVGSYTPGELDGLVDDRAVKPCGVNPWPMLNYLEAAAQAHNDTSVLPSIHCRCSWLQPAESMIGECKHWYTSTSVQSLGPFFVVVANMLMSSTLRFMSRYEGHYSSKRMIAGRSKVFAV